MGKKTPEGRVITVRLTTRCCYQCAHCCFECGPRRTDGEGVPPELPGLLDELDLRRRATGDGTACRAGG